MQFALIASSAVVAALAGFVAAQEQHTVHFQNNCGFGTPTLVQSGNIISQGWDVVIDGAFPAAIAYLQTGGCGLNGEGCTLVELSLINESGSSADISLIPPHSFSVTSGFGYYNGCDGAGADCTDPSCPTAFHDPSQTWVQVGCSVPNVNLAITFCD